MDESASVLACSVQVWLRMRAVCACYDAVTHGGLTLEQKQGTRDVMWLQRASERLVGAALGQRCEGMKERAHAFLQ